MPAITEAKITLKDSAGKMIGIFHPHAKASEAPTLLLEEVGTGKKVYLGVGIVRKFDRIHPVDHSADGFDTYFGARTGQGEFLVVHKRGVIDKEFPITGARWLPPIKNDVELDQSLVAHFAASQRARETLRKENHPHAERIIDLHERIDRLLLQTKRKRPHFQLPHLPQIHPKETAAAVKRETKEAALFVKKEAKEHPWLLTALVGSAGLLLAVIGLRQRKRNQ